MISKVSVCLEVGTQATSAFVPDYPGCWVFGRTKERALEKVRIEIAEWIEWQKRLGENFPELSTEVEIEVAEMLLVDYNPVEAGKPEPLFRSEVPSVNEDDIERTIRFMEYSRRDLLSLVSTITKDCLDWEPPGKPRTVRNCLKHIAHVESWYITRLNIDLPEVYPDDVFELLKYTRNIVIDTLRNFPEHKMKGIFQPTKDKSPVCDLWTARKVLRRLVDHERLHTNYIRKVLEMYRKRE
jgi:predicted RNase H-like HicB family nuclease